MIAVGEWLMICLEICISATKQSPDLETAQQTTLLVSTYFYHWMTGGEVDLNSL